MKVKSLLIGVFSLIALGMWVGSNYAEIDPQTIVAIWTFDEGKGDIAGDFSGNGHDGKMGKSRTRSNGSQASLTRHLSLTGVPWLKLNIMMT